MNMPAEPIVAIATAPGRSAIGIVRLSGTDLAPLVSQVFRPRYVGKSLRDRRPHVGAIVAADETVIDDGLLLWMDGPRTYTGEDLVELHCHGNPLILQQVVDRLVEVGGRLAQPGEFTRRAYLNDKLDLAQAEAVMQVIHADSELALKTARKVLTGELSQRIDAVRLQVLDVIKWAEMWIDFPEEDEHYATAQQMIDQLDRCLAEIGGLLSSFKAHEKVMNGVRVALCGPPNVGKSSLLNALAGSRRALVSDQPGTTRDVIEVPLNLSGYPFLFQDTAGLRETDNLIEQAGIAWTREVMARADIVLWLVDVTSPNREQVMEEAEQLARDGIPWLGVLTKWDLLPSDTPPPQAPWQALSSRTGLGLDGLRQRLIQHSALEDAGDKLMLLSAWQRDVLDAVKRSLESARMLVHGGMAFEAVAYELYEAATQLDGFCGRNTRGDVLDMIFAEFCLGK